MIMFLGGLGVGMGIVALTWLVWWRLELGRREQHLLARKVSTCPGVPVADGEFDQATGSVWCRIHGWEVSGS